MSKVCLCNCVNVLAGVKQYFLLCVTDDCCRWFVELKCADRDQLLVIVCSSVQTMMYVNDDATLLIVLPNSGLFNCSRQSNWCK